jgi:Zn-dependent metalloprotease
MRLRFAAFIAGLIALVGAQPSAQRPRSPSTMVIASTPQTVGTWDVRVQGLLRTGQLDLGRVQRDSLVSGRTHVRLNQRYRGLPVFGGQIVRQQAGQTLVSVFGHFFQNLSVDPKPRLSVAAARRAAIAAQGPTSVVSGTPVLGVLPTGAHGVLVYRMTVRSARDIQIYDVNADTGAIVRHESRIREQEASPAIGSGTGVNGDRQKVSANLAAGVYQAIDVMRPAVGFTVDFDGRESRFNRFFIDGRFSNADIATDSDNHWTDPAIVDAQAYQGFFYDYFYKVMGRQGLDDANHQIIGIVHPLARKDADSYSGNVVGQFINNALYLGDGLMLYGDGDGRNLTYLSGGIDVVAHELTHGITDFTSHLSGRDEPGALDEGFSDIMATAVEFAFQPAGRGLDHADWLIGEDVTLAPPRYIRSLQNPHALGDVDHYSQIRDVGTDDDNGGVHENSTIASHAFYLAVHGGTNRVSGIRVRGVGMANLDRVAKAFYRALAFMLGPNSDFADARRATLQAAGDLYGRGSNEYAQIEQAWTAVGVR